MLLEPFKQDAVFDIIYDPEIFYAEAHQIIYMAMLALLQRGDKIDLLTVTAQIRKANMLDLVGNEYYLNTLAMSVVSSAHIENHSRLLIELYMRRELAKKCGAAFNASFDGTLDIFDIVAETEENIDRIKNSVVTKPYRHVSKGIYDLQKKTEDLIARKVELVGINTGFKELNQYTEGWQKQNVYIVAARPGVGKTAFTLNTALRCLSDPVYGGPVGIFNLEMSEEEILKRITSAASGVKIKNISKPKSLSEEERLLLMKAQERIAKMRLYIDDTAGLTLRELSLKARRMVRRDGVKLIIIDYLQLLEVEDFAGNREQQIAKASRTIKKLAKSLDIRIIALSQMTRSSERDDRAPELSDLRESGAIEQDASLVMFLWRPNKQRLKEKPHLAGKILGMIKKNRHGENDVEVIFHVDNAIQRWTDEEPVHRSGTMIPDPIEELPF